MADHRVEQILVAIETTLKADGTFSVFRAPLDALQNNLQDVPAACIFLGEEIPRGDTGFEVMGSYSAAVSVWVDVWDQADQSTNIETNLLELRKLVHIALMQSTRLGLAFVFNLAPLGADEPELSSDGSAISGKLRTNWLVEYRSSVEDPSA